MLWVIGAAVVVVGASLAVQPLLNAGWPGRRACGLRAMFSVLVSSLTMLVAALLLRLPLPDVRGDRRRAASGPGPAGSSAPAWCSTALTATPRLGAATTVMLFIAGQLACSLLIDHCGLLGVPVHPIDLRRVRAWPA